MVKIVGYSSVNSDRTQRLSGVALVNVDLLNAFYAKRGSNRLRPNEFCALSTRLFSQYYAGLNDDIKSDIMGVINKDPRVSLISYTLNQQEYGVTINLVLQYTELNTIEELLVTFNTDTYSQYGY